jgi:hypothetical protein
MKPPVPGKKNGIKKAVQKAFAVRDAPTEAGIETRVFQCVC